MRKMDERRFAIIAAQFREICALTTKDDGSIHSVEGWTLSRKLADEIYKDGELHSIIGRDELQAFILEQADKVDDVWPPESDAIEYATGEALTRLMYLLIESPFEHTFFYKLPFAFPEGLNEVDFGHGIKIATMLSASSESEFSALLKTFWIGLPELEAPKWRDTFAIIRTSGYGAGAKAAATSTLKEFLYLSGCFARTPPRMRKKAISFDQDFYISQGPDKGLQRSDIQDNIRGYLSRIRLRGNVVGLQRGKHVQPEDLENVQAQFRLSNKRFITLKEKTSPDTEHISAAIEWGFDSIANDNETFAFVQNCIGIEAILGDKKENDKRGLVAKLSDRCAYLLGTSKSTRSQIADAFESIYDSRSKLVHGTKYRLSDEERVLAARARELLRELVNREILYASGEMPAGGSGLSFL